MDSEKKKESVLDDFQSVDLDINSLVTKFIKPIDQYRSRTSPNICGSINQGELQLSKDPVESRAHTFFRILGLPTITPNGKFFNPGFNPFKSNEDLKTQASIASAIPNNVKTICAARELTAQQRYWRFNSLNLDATVHAIVIGAPKCQRQLMVMNASVDALLDSDPQSMQIPGRTELINIRYKKRDESDIKQTFSNMFHILRPFMTDPIISANIEPKSGSNSVMIAAPFLEKDDIEYEFGKYLRRSGLEFILRLRLRQQNIQEQSNTSISEIDLSSFSDIESPRSIAAALSGIEVNEEDVNDVLKDLLKKSGSIELYTINDLIKTYKGLINLWHKSIKQLENVYNQIVWIPAPNKGGPEKGCEISTMFLVPKKPLDSWETDRRIMNLQIKSSIAKQQMEIGEDLNFSDFIISEFNNLNNTFSEQLKQEENKRNRLETQASNALRTIEYISGEISGLGLIDIIAIYLALWSVPINVLLDLIDDTSAERLGKIKELQTTSVIARVKKVGNAREAYFALENRIISILSYGDRLFTQADGTPDEQEGGDIERTNSF
ncbi:MAG: hypothetical protein WC942_03050 [Clostridia bacterium]|jgi:hypothetical protein